MAAAVLAEAEFNEAVPLVRTGLITLRERGDFGRASEMGYRAALALYDTGRFRTAEAMIFAVLSGTETADGKAQMAAPHYLAGAVRVERDKFADAAYSARQAREIYLELKHPQAANALANWAETLLHLGKSLTGSGAAKPTRRASDPSTLRTWRLVRAVPFGIWPIFRSITSARSRFG